jgi:hypothetical protein
MKGWNEINNSVLPYYTKSIENTTIINQHNHNFVSNPIKLNPMFAKLKLNVAIISIAALIVTATVTAPYTKMFGKHYNNNQDYTCCKGDQLVAHHYYTVNVLWLTVSDGYTDEVIGKPQPGECNIKCND